MATGMAETCRRHTIYYYMILLNVYNPLLVSSPYRYQASYAYDLGHVIRCFGTVFHALQCTEQSFLFRIRCTCTTCNVEHGTHRGAFSFRTDKQKSHVPSQLVNTQRSFQIFCFFLYISNTQRPY